MDFVERILGVSPDNGTGWFELSLLLLAGSILAGKFLISRRASRTSRSQE